VSLPVLVSLMRLAVPLWVFIFGILLTPYYDAQVATCHQWFLFEYGAILQQL
jgi:surface polysaccharide O-acyltransferase-like enzyme